ncbi:hypothetical protein [Pseudomonas huaxiensis]|uniref:hypothetical protein n=1 Tax=Pseudomonas huaxiensis TaxID=2213017 RepID=UPI000DA65F13|nr:hypothetical protein [Pseudomonas huaxiensis]
MQQLTKEIQIHVRGSALIQLHFAGRCVGFALTYQSAGHQADQLDRLLSAIRHHGRNFPFDATANVSFSSFASEQSVGRVSGVTKEAWVVEAGDGTPIRSFPSHEVAEWFREAVEAYDRLMPPCGEDGEWTVEQIEWFRSHPAPIASACGGRLKVRWAGFH